MKIYQNKGHGGVGLRLVFKMPIALSVAQNQFENPAKRNFWPGNS